jgi:hypothetical protein
MTFLITTTRAVCCMRLLGIRATTAEPHHTALTTVRGVLLSSLQNLGPTLGWTRLKDYAMPNGHKRALNQDFCRCRARLPAPGVNNPGGFIHREDDPTFFLRISLHVDLQRSVIIATPETRPNRHDCAHQVRVTLRNER